MEQNRNNQPNDNKKPKLNIWVTLMLTVGIVLLIALVFNAIAGSQYTETTYSDFKDALDKGQLEEVQIQADRILYLTKEEAAKPAAQQKACYTGLPTGADTMVLADQLPCPAVLLPYQAVPAACSFQLPCPAVPAACSFQHFAVRNHLVSEER